MYFFRIAALTLIFASSAWAADTQPLLKARPDLGWSLDQTLDNTSLGTVTGETVAFTSLVSCDTIDTDANGNFVCGTDSEGAGASGDPVLIDGTAVTDASGVDLQGGADITITFNAGASPDTASFAVDDAFIQNDTDDAMTGDLTLDDDDAGTALTIRADAAGAAAGTPNVGLLITTDDDDDADYDPFEIRDDSGVNNDLLFFIDHAGTVTTGIWNAGAVTSSGTVEGATLTEGGNAVYNATETPGGELGGTFASFTIDDSVAVSNWNLTTPTITTSLTTSTPTTLSAAELDRLDGLAGTIVTTSAGTAPTATALAVDPGDCGANTYANAIAASGALTCGTVTAASADFANQGTTTTVLHGNAAGNPSWGAIVTGDITDGTILEADLNESGGAPSDNDFLTYNTAGTNFTWVSANAGTDITADLEEEVTEGSLADSTIVSADIKDGEVATGDIAADTITHANIADSDQTDTKCIWFEDPTADDDFNSIWRNSTANDFQVTEIWAESDQTVTFMLQLDDGAPADCDTADLAPAAGEAEDTSLDGDCLVAASEELDLAITSVANTPTWVSICWTGNWVD
jgi:hypothetical protein